jgi:hypothetical protein
MIAAVGLGLTLAAAARPAQARQAGARPSVRWVGQDGHDYVGPSNRLEPSGVQDMHFALAGLDPKREIVYVNVTTGPGQDQWEFNVQSFSWKAELKRAEGSRTADLFLEPGHVEAPRTYHVQIRYDDNSTHEFDVRGRKVSRSLRVPGAAVAARWMGQEGHDRVGPGPGAGPDGTRDVRIHLSGVSTKVPVRAIRVEGPGGARWESGANPGLLPAAEYWPDAKKPGEGDLFIQPERDLKGQQVKVVVLYANETLDTTTLIAGRCEPKLRTPETPLPRITDLAATPQWMGQDGQDATGPGDVHVRLSGLARTLSPATAVLTDSVRGTWVYRSNDRVKPPVPEGDVTGPLALRPGSDRGTLDLFFAPYRDETGATLTLRLIGQDGRLSVFRFPGGACDLSRRAPRPIESRIEAHPGDDLNALVNQYGSVHLAEGTYRLAHSLVLSRPVALASDGKATLVFTQAPSDAPWTAAIKIHAGNTTLSGFAVRFEGPIRWDQNVSYGPAAIGTTDDRDQGHRELKVNLVLNRLDLESPAAPDLSKWIDAVRLIRLTNASGGVVAGNILRGGTIEFFGGPWQMLDNDFRGTPAGTISHAVFAGHGTHDLLIRGNRVKPIGPAGKTWRFLVLTHRGSGDRVEDNIIEDIGSREDDTLPWSNEPEIILTEAYHLTYEGKVLSLSPGGNLLRIHTPQGDEAATGDVVSLLAGPATGEFRRIAQVIDAQSFLVDPPVPKGTEAVSISRGFVGESFERNRIDIRRGRRSAGMVLVGNHFGTRLVKNHIQGGDLALKFTACPTESPVTWGWSHAPVLQAVIDDNIFEDCQGGAWLGVEHSARDVKSNKGRTYMSIAMSRNVLCWSEAFLERRTAAGEKSLPPGLVLGHTPSHDPGEFVVKATGNRLRAPAGARSASSLLIHAAEYNSQKILDRKFALPSDSGLPDAATSSPGRSRRLIRMRGT